MLVILVSSSVVNFSRFAFRKLNLGVGLLSAGLKTGLISISTSLCWDFGIGFMMDFTKLLKSLDEAKAKSGLYPLLHLALKKDSLCLVSW